MKFWIGVASKDHVQSGIDGGFCQLCHGRSQPLERMNVGDWIVYYSPKESQTAAALCQRFTAIGEVTGERVYEFKMTSEFEPFRRDVCFMASKSVDIRPLVDRLSFIKDKQRWGIAFRFGYLQILRFDFALIAENMLDFDPSAAASLNRSAA